MAKSRKPTSAPSNAVRQAAYRQRPLNYVNGQGERINRVGTVQAMAQLGRLAKHYGGTQGEIIEQLVAEAERKTLDDLSGIDAMTYFSATD